ncbi:four-carbon acid sugar kinase family protein [Natronincola ferrireducens]|uniref:Uncharacterized conserved protein YgbK, DUF1537 family n=1 Tax=Natronincola ferrireducens TaxID=393762 RepID=A0A1G9GG11_9FIRM|nr:four-carbon acid sugar kinase family protein [Natronincola ferrireducens]SDK99203.1 Uncharacterized conserved protein YgbK, DUF1537 family [Natronincola ferrireducens]
MLENKNLFELQGKHILPSSSVVEEKLNKLLQNDKFKIVVLDDDPTGTQTVHGVHIYTNWDYESILKGFKEKNRMFFILTNSRAFTTVKTKEVHEEIAKSIIRASEETGKKFIIVSRGDSTLRGHYPLETLVLKNTIEKISDIKIDGEIIIPFFQEGERYTVDNIHYAYDGDELVPVAETEFAKDKTFGYSNSHLGKWIEEKTEGEYKSQDITYVSIKELRALEYNNITNKLLKVDNFNKVVVNALDYIDIKIFITALMRAINENKNFILRSASSVTKIIGGIKEKSLLSSEELIDKDNPNGGVVIVGSHVNKTTKQLENLIERVDIEPIEFNQHLVLDDEAFSKELNRVINLAEESIVQGRNVVVFTKRERFDLGTTNKEEELIIAVKISNAITSIVERLKLKPSFIVGKGGITSSDIATKGLAVKKALVIGQIRPGVPVWLTGSESKFPNIPYIIFPGNVGNENDLTEIVKLFKRK